MKTIIKNIFEFIAMIYLAVSSGLSALILLACLIAFLQKETPIHSFPIYCLGICVCVLSFNTFAYIKLTK